MRPFSARVVAVALVCVFYACAIMYHGIAETGLEILYELLMNVGRTPSVSQGFYRQFLLSLIQVRKNIYICFGCCYHGNTLPVRGWWRSRAASCSFYSGSCLLTVWKVGFNTAFEGRRVLNVACTGTAVVLPLVLVSSAVSDSDFGVVFGFGFGYWISDIGFRFQLVCFGQHPEKER